MSELADVVYMDYAATSAVRPPVVTEAVTHYLASIGASPGRSSHCLAVEAGRIALRCRMALARVFGIPGDPGRIAFMFNATHALNTALWGTLRQGDTVVITPFDHNAVLRTVHRLSQERGVQVRTVPGDATGALDLAAAARMLEGAKVLVINAASNVLGTVLPVAQLSRLAHDAGALVLIDAAQSAGHVPTDARADDIDMIAFTGHKGLLGPPGTGGLWVREGLEVEPLITGGTGGNSLLREMPPTYPDHLEAGTFNGPGLAGLLAGVEWLVQHGVEAIHQREIELKSRLREGMAGIRGVRVLSPAAPDGVAVVTVVADGMDPSDLSNRLDREHGILTRAGLHCAPEVHRLLGTEEAGAVRFSLGWASTPAEVDRAIEAMATLVHA